MNWLLKRLAVIFIFCTIPALSMAIDLEDAMYPELATSGRALAMGNAYMCKVDDSASVFYNPAGLGTVRKFKFHFSNFLVETNKGWLDTSTGGSIGDVFGNLMNGLSLNGVRTLLNDKTEKGVLSHLKYQLMPNITMRYLTAGYLYSSKSRAIIEDTAGAQFEYADRLDHGPYAGLNLSLFGGVLKVGASGILLFRSEAIGSADPAATLTLPSSAYNSGTALILTGGARLTLPMVFLPTFSAVFHNLQGSQFGGGTTEINKSIDFGASITPQMGKSVRVHLEVNVKDFTNTYSEVALMNKILIGTELDINRKFFLRTGYGNSQLSFGIGIKTKRLEFDLTSYAAELSMPTGSIIAFPEILDRRYVFSVSSGL
jgi:hypothetical protein